MGVPFDHIASAYDSAFARSVLGQLQRRHVWNYLEKIIPQLNGLEMLELNSGNGEDAMMFSEKGFNIIATDVSEEMLKVTHQKTQQYSMHNKISSHYIDLDNFNEALFDKKFDLVFSNFGGLNSINPESLKKLIERIPSILNPKGRFVAVVMPKFCFWESTYFLCKLQWKKMFRRWTTQEVISNTHGVNVKSWFYHPAEIKRWTKGNFKLISTKPIGLMLPPSYLENIFANRKRLLLGLNKMEKKLNLVSLYAGMADHYIIDMQLK